MYAVYFRHELRGGGEADSEDLEPLRLAPRRGAMMIQATVPSGLGLLCTGSATPDRDAPARS